MGAHYILAQDPDADRFSAAEKKLVYLNFQFIIINTFQFQFKGRMEYFYW